MYPIFEKGDTFSGSYKSCVSTLDKLTFVCTERDTPWKEFSSL
jgi:hypothetical protein